MLDATCMLAFDAPSSQCRLQPSRKKPCRTRLGRLRATLFVVDIKLCKEDWRWEEAGGRGGVGDLGGSRTGNVEGVGVKPERNRNESCRAVRLSVAQQRGTAEKGGGGGEVR